MLFTSQTHPQTLLLPQTLLPRHCSFLIYAPISNDAPPTDAALPSSSYVAPLSVLLLSQTVLLPLMLFLTSVFAKGCPRPESLRCIQLLSCPVIRVQGSQSPARESGTHPVSTFMLMLLLFFSASGSSLDRIIFFFLSAVGFTQRNVTPWPPGEQLQ